MQKIGLYVGVIWICVSFSVIAQIESQFSFSEINTSENKHRLTMDSRYYSGSNTLTNQFMNQAFGGLLSDEIKQNAYKDLTSKNRAGYFFNYGLYYQGKIFNNSIELLAGVRSSEFFHAQFSKEALMLVLSGNTIFPNQKTTVSPFSYYYSTYEDIVLGLGNINLTPKSKLYTWLSIRKTSNYQLLNIYNADIYTSALGDSIQLYANLKSENTPMGIKRVHAYSGMGVGVNLQYFYFSNPHRVELSILDIGMSRLRNLSQYAIQSGLTFTGIDIDDFKDSTLAFESFNADSIDGIFGAKRSLVAKWINHLPFIKVQYSYETNHWYIQTGVMTIFNAHFVPLVYVYPNYKLLGDRLMVAPALSYGGYEKFSFGLNLSYEFLQNFKVTMQNFYLENVFLPKVTHGQGLQFSIIGSF